MKTSLKWGITLGWGFSGGLTPGSFWGVFSKTPVFWSFWGVFTSSAGDFLFFAGQKTVSFSPSEKGYEEVVGGF